MNSSEPCFFKESGMSPVLGIILLLEFALGLIGNGVVLYILCFCIPSWNISTLYLFNVSFADFLLIACLPFRADYFLHGKNWNFGDIPCRFMLFTLSLSRTGSIFFLTAVVVNRYYMIVHPHFRINMIKTIPGGLVVTITLWAVIILLSCYLLFTSHLVTEEIANKTLCESFNLNWDKSLIISWHYVFFVIQLIIPLIIILVCTGYIVRQLQRCKDNFGKIKRTIKSMTFVAFVFIFCFLPSTVSTIIVVISKYLTLCWLFDTSSLVFAASLSLTYFNSVLNPLAIYISSLRFQKSLNNACNCAEKRRLYENR
uniref:G-protein coupled receptors family 1 profile domain-containing protein n=1 Tax=Pyxicephalus adspersus TaxID=30357 RepID=A0AAV3A7R1_PYXAD|nr:TPA: hypothetical protein GDO54_014104 [Pyxicephalus adspersus]